MMMAAEVRAGRSTIDALESLADRLAMDEAKSLVLVLRQSLELGSDIGDTLRIFSEEMRDKRYMRAEALAHALPVKIVIPVGFCIFPVILVVLFLPLIIRIKQMLQFRRITTQKRFIPQIDGLRLVAISSVALLHLYAALETGIIPAPWSMSSDLPKRGVELFFAISGFILGIPFASHYIRKAARVDLKQYFLRRLTRLEFVSVGGGSDDHRASAFRKPGRERRRIRPARAPSSARKCAGPTPRRQQFGQ